MKRIGDLLKAFLSTRLSAESERIVELVEAWRELAGNAAPHVRVRDLRGRVLVLEADHPGWGQLVGLRKASLLSSLQKRFPDLEIQDLRVTMGRGEEAASAESGAGRKRPRDSPGEQGGGGKIDAALSALPDEGMRKALRALYEQAEEPEEPDR